MPIRNNKKRPWQSTSTKPFGQRLKNGKAIPTDPFYLSPIWKATRARHLAMFPLCVECEKLGKITKGEVVDHIKPRDPDHPERDLDPNNLQTMCHPCHNRKSNKERRNINK